MFPNDPYIGEMAQEHLFHHPPLRQGGAPRPYRRDQQKVKRCLELGWNIEAPEGSVFLEPGTHHCAHLIRTRLLRRKAQRQLSARLADVIQAWWLQRLGVNLIRNPRV